jgi:general secretion pathway protein K
MRRQQRGVALLTAILLVAIGTILAAAIAFQNGMTARRASATFALDQATLAAESAEALAAFVLREDGKDRNGTDNLQEQWAMPVGPLELAPGIMLEAQLEDLSGRFNLNSLVDDQGRIDPLAVSTLEYLLRFLDLDGKWAWLIADWIDRDNQPQSAGAEDLLYTSQTPPYLAPNTLVVSTSELLSLQDFGRENFAKLAPYVTALPQAARLNVCTADAIVLDALSSAVQQGEVLQWSKDRDAVDKAREDGCFPTEQDYLAAIPPQQDARRHAQARIDESSNYFRLTSFTTIGTSQFALYSLLRRIPGGNAQTQVLLRSFTAD